MGNERTQFKFASINEDTLCDAHAGRIVCGLMILQVGKCINSKFQEYLICQRLAGLIALPKAALLILLLIHNQTPRHHQLIILPHCPNKKLAIIL